MSLLTIFLTGSLLMLGVQVQAEIATRGSCRVSALIENGNLAHFPTIAFGDRIDFPLMAKTVTEEIEPRFGGGINRRTVIFGDVSIDQDVRLLDVDFKIVRKRLRVRLNIPEPQRDASGKFNQSISFEAQVENPLTAQIEVFQSEFDGNQPYAEHSFTNRDRNDLKVGDLIGHILFCQFSSLDSMGGDLPGRKSIDDFARP